MSKGKVVILGVNGHIGRAAAAAFVANGWDVTGMARTDKYKVAGVRFVRGDSDSVEDMRRAIGSAQIVLNALNLPYDKWDKGRLEGQMARVLEALGTSGKTMLFPGNIYNYCASERVVTPNTPQRPQTPRGEIRKRVEAMFEAAAARGDIQAIILRAGDFYGPHSVDCWFDLAMFREAQKGRVATLGLRGVGHSWAYLPDLARAFEALAAMRSTLGGFERFHFRGHHATPEQMEAAIRAAVVQPLKVSAFPLVLFKLLGLWNPVLRETAKMDYLWRKPMELSDGRLEAMLGEGFDTPFAAAIAATVRPFFEGADGAESARLLAPAEVNPA